MNTRLDTTMVTEYHPTTINLGECRPEYQHSTSEVGGVSSSPLQRLIRTGLVTGIAIMGTIPLPVEDVDLTSSGIEVRFVFPPSDFVAEDEYSRIRDEIVASGLPMLSDDEVRAEIRERKGVRGDTES